MAEIFFITGTGTGVGKTFVTAKLCREMRESGKKVRAIKPIISGYKEGDTESDTAKILNSLGLPITQENIDIVSPWRFAAPLSPDMAAAREGRETHLKEVVDFCKESAKYADILLIEGVGGVMVPLNNKNTICDLMAELGAPVILVAGSYLGTISHTLSAVETLKARGLKLHQIIISESEESLVPLEETRDAIAHFLPDSVPIMLLARNRFKY